MDQPTTPEPGNGLWTAAEYAALLRISMRQFWRLRAAGELPWPVRVGRRCVRWRGEDVARYLEGLKPAR